MGAGIGYISLGPQHLAHQNYRVHPISSLVWRRSHHTRRAQVRIFSHGNRCNHSDTAVCAARSSRNARLQAASNLDKYHQETKSWRDKKVLQKNINPEDMVLIRHPDKLGKLQSQWYGPFVVANMVKTRVYKLLNKGVKTNHTWNADNL